MLLTKTEEGITLRQRHNGLVGIGIKVPVQDNDMLSVVYTPGVAQPCLEIQKNPLLSFDITMRGNTIGLVSNGSSVYGLGNAGASATIPMLEGKSILYKTFSGIDAVPLAIQSQDPDVMVETIRQLEPTFGGFHLDGIVSPQCYTIEETLRRGLGVPVMHGEMSLAVVVAAALINALKVRRKAIEDLCIVIHGAGTSGIGMARLLMRLGAKNLRICDEFGLISADRPFGMNWLKAQLARQTNPARHKATLADSLAGADCYIGFKDGFSLSADVLSAMNLDAIVFAMALPNPEITYEDAKATGASVVLSQASTSPNGLSASMAYPGIFRGALDVRATDINESMLVSAAYALAGMVSDEDLDAEHILPSLLLAPIAATVARAVAEAAILSGVAQVKTSPQRIEQRVIRYSQEGSQAWVGPDDPDISVASSKADRAMALRYQYQGVIEVKPSVEVTSDTIYSQVYSKPNAVKACQMVIENPESLFDMTCKNNLVGVVTDGTAVLGLGNIGAGAGLPVMEGKSVLFKAFGGVDAFPICLQVQDTDELVATIKNISPVFGGINLEDIAAPRCFEIEERLIAETDIPIFHDDQHGTAVVTVAAILNALKVVDKAMGDVRVVVNGAGAAALSVSKLLLLSGIADIVICDTQGVIYQGRPYGMNFFKHRIAEATNLGGLQGTLEDAVRGTDIFIGLSAPGTLTQAMVRTMAPDPVILAMANPTPEIMPEEAFAAGAKIVGTGRSDFPNQVNNCLAFPGIFRGTLDVRASRINDAMKLAAAHAIANQVTEAQRQQGIIIPSAFNLAVPPAVAQAVAQAAMDTGVARRPLEATRVAESLKHFLHEGTLLPLKKHFD